MAPTKKAAAAAALEVGSEEVKAFLSGPLAVVTEEPDTGAFADDAAYLRTLEVCASPHAP